MSDGAGAALPVSLGDAARRAARRYAQRTFMVCPSGVQLSYELFDRLADAAALALAERGVGLGDVVALVLPSSPLYLALYVGASRLGAATAGVNPRLAPPERQALLELARPRIVVGTEQLLDGVAVPASAEVVVAPNPSPAQEVPAHAILEGLATTSSPSALIERAGQRPLEADPDPERPLAIVFTSGTTGTPKGAVFGWSELAAVTATELGRWHDLDAPAPPSTQIAGTSFAHVGTMTKLPTQLLAGGTSVLLERFDAEQAIRAVERYRVTTLGGIPAQLALMLRHPLAEQADLSSVRMVVLGGGPVTPALVKHARARLGVPVVVRYTCTEAGVGTGTEPDDPPEAAELTVGRARFGVEVTVRDEQGRTLPAGSVGEVYLRSAAVMQGYLGDPTATKEVIAPDGAVATGDLGYLDEDGRLRLVGRRKEMFVRGGYNVFPAIVEACLAEHPKVREIAVVPRPDEVMGEVGVAVVVARDASLSLKELRRFGRPRLAAHELPEALLVVDELPRTPMDKIDRAALARLVQSARAAPQAD
jgi:acyl-CoA synthetase (AMP-forming)/AMP-acid ligase II